MTADPPPDPVGSWLLLAIVGGWLCVKSAVAFVRLYERLDHLPPHPPHRKERIIHMATRYPLRVGASIVGGLTAAVSGLVGSGLFTTEQGSATTGIITAAVTLLAAFGITVTGERKVTPLADPRDQDGTPLVPADTGESPTTLY
ncbi:hypothetical protein [Actinokineospora terrae]|uniref:Uncharacterized protein n=1 Tax=Actinokineospora terrae TaxID=155974 RepID=A0A1H9XSC2_9PSEU|nr:hypothetical protein [Actinokineospora terrae]SES49052.1 hypothetical protein SAMN04487818_1243 [Actinokineospora terrae]